MHHQRAALTGFRYKSRMAFIYFCPAGNIAEPDAFSSLFIVKSDSVVGNGENEFTIQQRNGNSDVGCFGVFDDIIQLLLENAEGIQLEFFAHRFLQRIIEGTLYFYGVNVHHFAADVLNGEAEPELFSGIAYEALG